MMDKLLSFLKEDQPDRELSVDMSKNIHTTKVPASGAGPIAIDGVSYEISGVGLEEDGVADEIVIEQDGRKYIFEHVVQVDENECIASNMKIEPI